MHWPHKLFSVEDSQGWVLLDMPLWPSYIAVNVAAEAMNVTYTLHLRGSASKREVHWYIDT